MPSVRGAYLVPPPNFPQQNRKVTRRNVENNKNQPSGDKWADDDRCYRSIGDLSGRRPDGSSRHVQSSFGSRQFYLVEKRKKAAVQKRQSQVSLMKSPCSYSRSSTCDGHDRLLFSSAAAVVVVDRISFCRPGEKTSQKDK